jgi:hypothetical protein
LLVHSTCSFGLPIWLHGAKCFLFNSDDEQSLLFLYKSLAWMAVLYRYSVRISIFVREGNSSQEIERSSSSVVYQCVVLIYLTLPTKT